MSRHRGNVRALEPIKFCAYCNRPMERFRHPGGRLERLRDFERKKFCSNLCFQRDRQLRAASRQKQKAEARLAELLWEKAQWQEVV